MVKYERSKGRKDSKAGRPKRPSVARGGFNRGGGNRKGFGGRRSPGRETSRYSREKREIEMTKVTCSKCGKECEVPFKPNPSKPVYCNDCFVKNEKGGSGRSSNRDLDVINKKLDKIMKALDIE